MNNQYNHWQGESDKGTVVLQEDLNEIHIPRRLKESLVNHRYGKVLDPKNGQVSMGYIREEYEHQPYPKVLYHPEFGQAPEPQLAAYAAGCSTPEQSIQAHEAYQGAHKKWQMKNRNKLVQDEKEEKRLIAKGWKVQMPKPPIAADSPESDEI
jgi:hypothetical protein